MLRLRLLGSFELRGPRDRPLKIPARKTRALLAFLALQKGAQQSRERLAALLWEDADAELARSSLRQALTALRRALPEKQRALLEADAQQVALNPAQLQVDVLRLRALLAESTLVSLKAARALAAETLLEGFDARSNAFEQWVAAERRSLRRELAAAAARLAGLCREAADADGEIDALNWLLALEPLHEGAHRELMETFARSGRYTEALRQYQLCRTVLRRELDLAPEPATETLYRELMKKRGAGTTGTRKAPFAGRHVELSLMNTLLERAVATKRGRTIVIRGEAGIGKTRLLETLAETARSHGTAIHHVQVLDFGQVKARRPLAALCASLLGIGAEADPAERGRAVAEAIESRRLPADSILHASGLIGAPLSADQASIELNVDAQALEHGRIEVVRRLIESVCALSPLLLVIEDLHYAGGEEAARLGELAASVASQPALLILSTRPDEDPIDAAWRARARGCPLTTLDLAPLTDEESRELAAGYPQLPEQTVEGCIRHAQGHPLFLDQLLRAADAGETAMPGSVQALVLARVEKLDRVDREALLAATALGLRFPRESLAAMVDDPHTTLDRLVDAGLLSIEGGEIAFVHALMREAVYESLLKSRRRELHARAAAWYAGRDAGLRAGHLAEADDPGAARACLKAATAEAEAFRLDRAVEFAEKACALAREPVDFCVAHCLLGEFQTRTGHTHDAIATLREVIDLRPDALLEVRARLALANALRILDRYDEALAALGRAEAVLAGHDRPELLARIWTLRGNIHFTRGELDACLAAHEQALAWAHQANSPVDEARALGGLGDAWYQRGRMRTARDHFAKCVTQARQHGAIGLALSNAPMLALTRAICGEVWQGLADCTEIVAEASRFGDPRSELLARDVESMVSLFRADYERARRACDRGLALARQLGARRFEAELMALQGHALGELGGSADAQVLLRQATNLALEVARTYCGPWCLGIQALHTPNVERARELLAQGEAFLAQGCVSHNHLEFRRLAMEFNLRHGDYRETRRHAAALRVYTREESLPWSDLVVRRAEWLSDQAEDPARDDLASRREALLREITTADFAWLLRGL
ncbi:MAG: BTAD domain-containing putative transcriptional regulator [Steroidobacteraceae bacterium]